jgi:hypothetical protein
MRPEDITVNGVRIHEGAQPTAGATRELSLPSGKRAAIRKGFGRDLMRAQRVAGLDAEPGAVVFALIAELAEVDGRRILFEDVLAMELEDVLLLQGEVIGPNFQSPPPLSLPRSSSSESE